MKSNRACCCRPKAKEGEDEAADPRAELVRRLLEYEKMKLAAQQINALPHHGRDFVQAQVLIEQSLPQRFPDVDVAELQAAWRDIVRRAKLVQHHHISREALSVREYISRRAQTTARPALCTRLKPFLRQSKAAPSWSSPLSPC